MVEVNLGLGLAASITPSDASIGAPTGASGFVNFGVQARDQNRTPSVAGLIPVAGAKIFAQNIDDPFWQTASVEIDPTRWDKRFPYQLLVVQPGDDASKPYRRHPMWEFTLPIPPEGLSIQTPFAMSVGATLGGVVENNGGAPFRNIVLRGHTGIMPVRDTAANSLGVPDAQQFTGGLFAGAISSFTQVAQTAAQRLGIAQANLMSQTELDVGLPGFAGRGTGYYQFHLLRVFLESYAAMRKRPDGKSMRLALAVWKDSAVYLVSPVSFDLARTAADPLGYPYNIVFKSWRRVQLDGAGPGPLEEYRGAAANPALLQDILGRISDARDTLEGLKGVLQSVRADVDQILDVARQSALLIKDALGVTQTLADLPVAIASDAAAAGSEFLSIGTGGVPSGQHGGMSKKALNAAREQESLVKSADRERTRRREQASAAQKIHSFHKGRPVGVADRDRLLRTSATQTAKMFGTPRNNGATMASIPVAQLRLRPAVRAQIAAEMARVRRITAADHAKARDDVMRFMADYAASVGAGSESFDTLYGRKTVVTTRTPTDLDRQILDSLLSLATQYTHLAVSGPRAAPSVQAMDVYAGMARRSGVAFTTPQSKFAVPWPYGNTIEQVAARYLGDPNRWMEIVALNGLRAPFVDETGFEVELLTDGRNNEVVVASAANLYVGQAVTLHSDNTTPSKRRITKIDERAPGIVIVRVDGEADCSNFERLGGASLHAYLPDTVNSQQQIFIPSQQTVDDEIVSRAIPGLTMVAGTIERGGVDLLLGPNGDAVMTPDGDWRLAIGMTNLVQRVRIAMGTARGSLPQHPDFGLGLEVGASTADMDARQIMAACRGMFGSDPDFTGVQSINVSKNGPELRVTATVGVAGQETLLPVSLDVLR